MQHKTTTGAQQQQPATLQPLNINYPGNKHSPGTPQKIINQLPPHDVFVSGFLGTCAVMGYKRPANRNIGIDLNLNGPLKEYWSARTDLTLVNQPFLDWINQFTFNNSTSPRWLIYLDPPYLFSSRATGAIIYDHELTDADHLRLLAWAQHITQTSNVKIAISHYTCPTYDNLLKHGWRKIEYKTRTHSGRTVMESLYMNYPEPEELHQYNFLGSDRMERQKIKRQVSNVLAKLNRLPAQKRNAVLALVAEHYKTAKP